MGLHEGIWNEQVNTNYHLHGAVSTQIIANTCESTIRREQSSSDQIFQRSLLLQNLVDVAAGATAKRLRQ